MGQTGIGGKRGSKTLAWFTDKISRKETAGEEFCRGQEKSCQWPKRAKFVLLKGWSLLWLCMGAEYLFQTCMKRFWEVRIDEPHRHVRPPP